MAIADKEKSLLSHRSLNVTCIFLARTNKVVRGFTADFCSVYICLRWTNVVCLLPISVCSVNVCSTSCLDLSSVRKADLVPAPRPSGLLLLLLYQAFAALSPPCRCDMADSGTSGEFSASLSSSTLPPPRTRIFKIIVIGDSGVGKTCLTYRFCAGKFPEKTEATIGVDFRERLVDIDGEKIKVCILQKTLR